MGYQIALRIGDGVVEWVWFRSSFCAKQVPHSLVLQRVVDLFP